VVSFLRPTCAGRCCEASPANIAAGIRGGATGDLYPEQRSILLPAAPFERLLRSRKHQLDLCPRVRVGIRRPVLRKLADGHDKQVFPAIAKHIRRALVYINEFSRCDIQHEDRIGNVLEDDAEAPLAFPQLALLMHALGDVDDCADEADHLPGLDRLRSCVRPV